MSQQDRRVYAAREDEDRGGHWKGMKEDKDSKETGEAGDAKRMKIQGMLRGLRRPRVTRRLRRRGILRGLRVPRGLRRVGVREDGK
jgi:hypothetical protein